MELYRSNRTFMELKFVVRSHNGIQVIRSNRTFMELKSVLGCG